ncbi:MAG: hypothetical protein M3343_11515 [Actinomycetota bacterium]|nr:hypothetical protein [Actinomycetota bacterium]
MSARSSSAQKSSAPQARAARVPQRRADLRIVRRKRRGLIQRSASRRVTPVVIAGAIVVALLIATVLLEQVLMAQSAFKLEEIRQRIDKAEGKKQELVLEVTRLENNGRIDEYARRQLGMIETDAATSEYMVASIRLHPGAGFAQAPGPDELELSGTAASVGTGQGP